jgi:hypothetical protein
MYRRGGLYSGFVSSGRGDEPEETKPYRGAEIPPPKSLGTSGYVPKRQGPAPASSLAAAAGVNKQG